VLRAATTRESNGGEGAPPRGIKEGKQRHLDSMLRPPYASSRCQTTSVAAHDENNTYALREHAQTTPRIMRSAGICGWATGVVAVTNATRKGCRAAARQSCVMSMERLFRVRNAPSSAVIGSVTVIQERTNTPSGCTKSSLLATAYCESQTTWSVLDWGRQTHRGVL